MGWFAPEVGDFGPAQPERGESGERSAGKGREQGVVRPVVGEKRVVLLREWETLDPLGRKGARAGIVRPVVGENGGFAPEVGDFGAARPIRGRERWDVRPERGENGGFCACEGEIMVDWAARPVGQSGLEGI
jgi:hypothetical protein